jgi:hypothetical protein
LVSQLAGIDEVRPGLAHRADQGLGGGPPRLEHRRAKGEHLLDPRTPDLRGGEHDHPDPARDRRAVPRFAHAGAVDLARSHRVGHEWRGNGGDLYVLVGPDAAAASQ